MSGSNLFTAACDSIGLKFLKNTTKKYFRDLDICEEYFGHYDSNDAILLIKKIKYPKFCLEVQKYSKKFTRKNCFISYCGNFFVIDYICEVNDYRFLLCQKLDYQRIGTNVIKVIGNSNRCRIEEMDQFEKCIPIFVNNNLYLAERPNDILNE